MSATAISIIIFAALLILYQGFLVWAAYNGKLMEWSTPKAPAPEEPPAASNIVAVLETERVAGTSKVYTQVGFYHVESVEVPGLYKRL